MKHPIYTTNNKVHSASFVCCVAAAFAAASALAFPANTKSLLFVCAAHLYMGTLSGSRIASSKAATRGAFNIGCPSDFKNVLCYHSAPKSCVTQIGVNCDAFFCNKFTRLC